MEYGKSDINYKRNKNTAKKADIIINMDREISAKLDGVSAELEKRNAKLDEVLSGGITNTQPARISSEQMSEIYNSLHEENLALKREIRYLAAQNENIFIELTNRIQELAAALSGQPVHTAYVPHSNIPTTVELNYDKLARKIVEILPAQEVISPDYIASKVAEQIIMPEYATPVQQIPVSTEIDYDKLAEKITPASTEIDYDRLAEKVAQILPVQEAISPDYIASKVAEQIIIPEYTVPEVEPAAVEIDYDRLAEKIVPATAEIDYDKLAEKIAPATAEIDYDRLAEKITPVTTENYTAVPAAVPVDLQLDEDELADRIALKVGGLKAEDFDILVDDDGCSSISEVIVDKLDYETIASTIAEKLRPTIEYIADKEPDYDELASRIGDKISIGDLNEEAIAQKTAEALSERLPEVDHDEIADKVVSQLIQSQENNDYDIVLDDEGIDKITEQVTEEVNKTNEPRFDEIDKELSEIKAMIAGGIIVRESSAQSEDATLVTVSDVVYDAQSEEFGEISELVDEIDEVPADGEIMYEDFDGEEGGVDFENMMKYNRSFIARIIQSTDEQKDYYGRVKTALLSYSKVNSSIAWGAERFNKGRETIARFKIRGKTLCLYLALNPTDYQYSVYHHVDVSDNKSMHGTPMMIKIKSPRGVKKAIRLIDDMLEQRGAVKRNKVIERNYAAMYPYEDMEELIEDGLVKDVSKK